MRPPQDNQEWQELLAELRKLTALIPPLQAIVDQDAQPGISDRLTDLMTELSRIGDAIRMSAEAMAKQAESADIVQDLLKSNLNQTKLMSGMQKDIRWILEMLGTPPQKAQAERPERT